MKKKASENKQNKRNVITHKKWLTVLAENGTFYCFWGKYQRLISHVIPFEKAHPFDDDLTNEFLKLPIEVQLSIIKVIFAHRLSWLFCDAGNYLWSEIYSNIYYELKNEMIESEYLTYEQKLFFARYID